jgi:hypothetical protein
MVEVLQEVARQSAVRNTFLGEEPAPALRSQLAALPPGSRDALRWRLCRDLGAHEIRLGNLPQAIGHLETAYGLLPDLRREMPARAATETVLALGVAWLRQAEVVNCRARHTGESCILPIRGSGIHAERGPSERAIRCFAEVLEQAPQDSREILTAKWLLNLAYMTIGGYPAQVPPSHLVPPEVFESDREFPRFQNIAPALGLDRVNLAGGAVAEDFDGDGFVDLMVSNSDTAGQMRYFRNDGDGGFSERTDEAGLTGLMGGLNMVSADYDNDGDTDVLVLRGAWWGTEGRHPKSLLRNEGGGRFLDVTFEAGLGPADYPSQTAGWSDYDLDGDVDLYVGNEDGRGVRAPGQLFRNEGDGTFREVAAEAGVTNHRYAKGVAWGDYDGDRFPDLYVSNMSLADAERGRNRLYRNNGDGTFTDVAAEAGVERPQVSFPTWFWDFDNDGALDLMVFAFGGPGIEPDVWFIAAGYLGLSHGAELACLYRGDGRGGFRNVAAEQNLRRPTLPMGSNFGDLDNDGFLDFYLGTGYPRYEGLMPNVMYHNERGAGFADVTMAGAFGHLQKGHGVAFVDLDNDGDLDVFEQMGGQYRGDGFANALYENPGFGQHWLVVKLVGARSNRVGMGARIRAEIVEGGERRSIYRHVGTGGSFGANSLLRQHLGLGKATRVELLEVFWPVTGHTQRLREVPADRYIEITEEREGFRELPYPRLRLGRHE